MKILILGGGPAGCAAAYFLKKRGLNDITIVEKEEIGGCARTRFYDSIPYEFGPQVLYTDEQEIREVFEEFIVNKKPPTEDGQYHPKLSINGKLDDPHDFPITIENVLKLGNSSSVIYELYKLNLDKADFSNFENYMLSRIGRTLYETYVKNYNLKLWKIVPSKLDAEWARNRTLTLRERNDMFQDRWQGHPGNHNKIWEGMTSGVDIIKADASVSDDFKRAYINNKEVKGHDLIISTLPLSYKLPYMHTLKIYAVIKENKIIMPSYVTTFPNNYNFLRIMEYKQQFYADSDFTLLDFAFSWNNKTGIDVGKSISEVKWFCKNILKRKIKEIFYINKKYTYPVSSLKSRVLITKKIELASQSKRILPLGRSGVHAYVSKDVCLRMGLIMASHLEEVFSCGKKKLNILYKLREKLR